ncbi:MAG: hypothetical protein WAN28_15885 [Terracidiphilus sp.]
MHQRLRLHRQRHTGTVRPAASPRRPQSLSFRTQPHVFRRGAHLAGSSIYYQSLALLVYGAVFLFMAHAFVVLYEEPTLRRNFGPEYMAYCARVHRWWPHAGVAD